MHQDVRVLELRDGGEEDVDAIHSPAEESGDVGIDPNGRTKKFYAW